MQGLIYLLNQAGEALAAANGEIARLHQEIERLTEAAQSRGD